MLFPDALLPTAWTDWAWLPLALVGWHCVRRAPWRRLGDGEQWNVWLAALVTLTLMWNLKAGVRPGLGMHLLGAGALTLMFGRELAMVGLALVLALVGANAAWHDQGGFASFALNALLQAVLPVLVADAVRRFAVRWLPAQFFVYIFITAFMGAALAMLASSAAAMGVLWAAGVYPAALLFDEYLPYFAMLGFAEAWLNGAAITLMVVYCPRWVGSFDDRRYLLNK